MGTAFLVSEYYAVDGETNEAAFVQLGDSVGIGPVPGRFLGGRRVHGIQDHRDGQRRRWDDRPTRNLSGRAAVA